MTATYKTVLQYNEELQQLKQMNSIVIQLLQSQLRYFLKHNNHKIQVVLKESWELHKKYFEIESGRIKQDKGKPIWLPEVNQDEYKKEFTEFCKKTIELKFA